MMKKKLIIYTKNFLLCGVIGWCLECIWTGLGSLLQKNRELTCKTSYWMFPIYGLASVIYPVYQRIKKKSIVTRGLIYTFMIYLVEFTSGCLLSHFHACPWDYSKAKLNIKGIIRLDYFPAWFGMGLLYEKILKIRTNYFKTHSF